MAEAYKVLAQGSFTSPGSHNVYSIGGATQAIIKAIFLQPTDASGCTVQVLAGSTYPLTGQIVLGAGEWAEWEGSYAMATGALWINLVAGTYFYVVSGVEIT